MLQARKISIWKGDYEITVDGKPVTTWTSRTWKTGGSFDLDGRRYEVGGGVWGSRYGMATKDGQRVASADRVGRKRWSVSGADGHTYEFTRGSFWGGDQLLLDDAGREVGAVRRIGRWRGDTEADLPGLPLPLQVFVLVVVLTLWEVQASAAVTSAG